LVLFVAAAVAMAGFARGTGQPVITAPQNVSDEIRIPVTPTLGKGGDVLFIMAAFSYGNQNAWGAQYWNPTEEPFPSTWSYDAVNPSTVEPDGSPYHWNGGMGTALDNLGYSWEWYPTYDGEDPAYQTIPAAATLLADYQVVVYWVGDYWNPDLGPALSDDTMAELEAYMTGGGKLILIGQDIEWSGVPEAWLQTWFGTGTITQDVLNGVETVPASGIAGTFAEGWSGTADRVNFYVGPDGSFYPDDMGDNGLLGDASYEFACYDDTNKRIYSTMQFETCASGEVEDLVDMIMTWMDISGALENSTWGEIKASF
jgi:hypothetical protein